MGILIDSADIDEVRKATGFGWVTGVTTNPSLLAKRPGDPFEIISEICASSSGPVFYQVTAGTGDGRVEEARRFHKIAPGRLVIKIPATHENMGVVSALTAQGVHCAATAVYAAHQALAACAAGAGYLIPYVNRATRLLGQGTTGLDGGLQLVEELAATIRATGCRTEIVAASIKSPTEAAAAVRAGAHHLTLPLAVIEVLGEHELSDQAVEQFDRDWRARG